MGFGKNGTGAILRTKETVGLATLAADAAIKLTSGITPKEDFRMLKAEIIAHVEGITTLEGTGLMIGIANGDLSVTEIAEAILADGPNDRNDRVKQEKAERFVKTFGLLDKQLSQTGGNFVGKGGDRVLEVKPRWTFSDPEGWDLFIFNNGNTLTTGATVELIATYYGLWLS